MTDGLSIHLPQPHPDAVAMVREALAGQGFGVLTEIDVQATMKAKLDADFEEFVILGACNPPLARRALDADRHIGTFLPCNVVVRSDGDGTLVECVDPAGMVQLAGGPELAEVAAEATARLRSAVAALASAPAAPVGG